MIQTHQQLKLISEEYNSLFSKNEFYPLQKAYTTPHFIVLSVRFPGRTVALYLGRGNQYQGVFLGDKFPPSYLRVQDRLLDYLRKFLVGARLGKMEIDDKNYVIRLIFKNEHADNSFTFGYKDRQLFFAKQSKEEIYTSWNGVTAFGNKLISLIDLFNPDKGILQKSVQDWTVGAYLKEEENKIKGQPIQKKKEKFLIKKIGNIESDLEGVKSWQLLQDDLKEGRVDLEVDELKLHGQKIKLQGLESPWLKRDLIFKKIKKLKKAEGILSNRLEESKVEFENVKKGDFEFEVTKEKVIQPLWISHLKSSSIAKSEYQIKNFRILGLSGVVGLDALSNDFIRSEASKEHYWFHVENYTGCHCILKTDDFSLLTLEALSAIASMMRDFSKLKILEIPILYTQVKNVKGLKGVKGQVLVKKAKHLRCLYSDWKEIITIL
jgi:hypothetical protein